MDNEQLLQALEKRFDSIESKIEKIQENIEEIKDDIEEIKEESKITRMSVNKLLDWADDASIQQIPISKSM